MANGLTELQAFRDQLEKAYYHGVRSVTVDGVTTTFGSGTELRRALNDVRRKIDDLNGVAARPRAASINMGTFP